MKQITMKRVSVNQSIMQVSYANEVAEVVHNRSLVLVVIDAESEELHRVMRDCADDGISSMMAVAVIPTIKSQESRPSCCSVCAVKRIVHHLGPFKIGQPKLLPGFLFGISYPSSDRATVAVCEVDLPCTC